MNCNYTLPVPHRKLTKLSFLPPVCCATLPCTFASYWETTKITNFTNDVANFPDLISVENEF